MKLYFPTIATLAICQANAWLLGPRYYDLVRPSLVWDNPVSEMMEKQQSMLQKAFTHVSPRYEITNTEDKYQISLDVPGVKLEDINVSLEGDGAFLSISGRRAAGDGEKYSYKSQFSQSFSLDPTVVVDKLTANLKNGVLVISAPKDVKRIEESVRKIPVFETLDEDTTKAIGEAKHDKVEETTAVKVDDEKPKEKKGLKKTQFWKEPMIA